MSIGFDLVFIGFSLCILGLKFHLFSSYLNISALALGAKVFLIIPLFSTLVLFPVVVLGSVSIRLVNFRTLLDLLLKISDSSVIV